MGLIAVAGQLLIATVFLASAAAKARDAAAANEFTRTVLRLAGVPGTLTRATTAATGAGEVAVGMLLTGALAMPPSLRASLLALGFGLALLLLLGFSAALLVALRADVPVPCGCFGAPSAPASTRHLLRNGVLMAVAVTGMAASGADIPAGWAVETLAAGTVGLVTATVVITFDDLFAMFAPSKKIRS